MDSSPLGSSVHRTLQARILEWVSTPGDLPNSGIKPALGVGNSLKDKCEITTLTNEVVLLKLK